MNLSVKSLKMVAHLTVVHSLSSHKDEYTLQERLKFSHNLVLFIHVFSFVSLFDTIFSSRHVSNSILIYS